MDVADAPHVELSIVPTEDVASLIAAGNKRFDDAIEEIRQKYADMAKVTLKFRWDVGKVAQKLFDEKSKALHERTYGEHVLEDVAAACRESLPTIWASIRLVMFYTEKDIEHFNEIQLPWRALAHLVSVREENVRNSLVKKWENEKFENSDDFKKAIVEHNKRMRTKKGEPGRQGGAGTYVRKFQSAEKALADVTGAVMPELLDLLKSWERDDNDKAAEAKALEPLEKIVEIIPALETMLSAARKAIKGGLKAKR